MHRRPGDYFGNMGAAILETPFTLIGDVIMTPIDLLEVFSGGR